MNKSRLLGAVFTLLIITSPLQSKASTIVFDNIPLPAESGGGTVVGHDATMMGSTFSPSSSGYLSDLWLPLDSFGGETGTGTPGLTTDFPISLHADNNGEPGVELERHYASYESLPLSYDGTPVHILANRTTYITADTQYWIVIGESVGYAVAWWNAESDIGPKGSVHRFVNVGEWDISTTYKRNAIRAAVIPVPAPVWLFGSGLIGLIGIARRKS